MISSSLPLTVEDIERAFEQKRWEMARRGALRALAAPGLAQDQANRLHRLLHDIHQCQGDLAAGSAALAHIHPATRREAYDLACTRALDFAHFTQFAFFRDSEEARAGLMYDRYLDTLRKKASVELAVALEHAETPGQRSHVLAMQRALAQTQEGFPLQQLLQAPTTASPLPVRTAETGDLQGTVRFEDGRPAAGVTVTLGLRYAGEIPDAATDLDPSLDVRLPMEPLYARTTTTDAGGRYHFSGVPAERHEFLARHARPRRVRYRHALPSARS